MEIDLFMELATPPGAGRDAAAAFEDGLAAARTADAGGFGAIWLAEHHFLGDYCNVAAPEMLLAAMARETTRIKLGFGILPLPLHDPVRIVERLVTLNLISAGRMLWGVGRGVTPAELAGFGIAPGQSRTIFLERFREMRSIMARGRVVRGGNDYVLQPPVGADHLGTGWLAAVSPESYSLAAELGLNVMAGPFKPWPFVRADLSRYRRLRPQGQTSFTLAVYCAQDHRAARRRAEEGILWTYRRILEVSAPFLKEKTAGYEHYRTLGRAACLLDKVLSLSTLEAMGLAAVGNPYHVARKLASLRDAGLDRVSLTIGGGDLTRDETICCLELLAREVMPQLAGANPLPATV